LCWQQRQVTTDSSAEKDLRPAGESMRPRKHCACPSRPTRNARTDVGWCLRDDFIRTMTPRLGGGRRQRWLYRRSLSRSIGPRAHGGHETQGRSLETREKSCPARGGPGDRSTSVDAADSERLRPSARGNPASLGEGRRDPQAASAVSVVSRFPVSAARLAERTREEMPEALSSRSSWWLKTRSRGQPRLRQSEFATVRAHHFGGGSSERTVRREQTRATGYGCRRGENLRRVKRWWESDIAPTRPKGRHERSRGNPANPMSGDGMQQARTPAAEKTVEVVHVPQGRNVMAGRHASHRTLCQRWRRGEWTQQGHPEEGHPISTREHGLRWKQRAFSGTGPLAQWRVEGDKRTSSAKRFFTESSGAPSGDLKPTSR